MYARDKRSFEKIAKERYISRKDAIRHSEPWGEYPRIPFDGDIHSFGEISCPNNGSQIFRQLMDKVPHDTLGFKRFAYEYLCIEPWHLDLCNLDEVLNWNFASELCSQNPWEESDPHRGTGVFIFETFARTLGCWLHLNSNILADASCDGHRLDDKRGFCWFSFESKTTTSSTRRKVDKQIREKMLNLKTSDLDHGFGWTIHPKHRSLTEIDYCAELLRIAPTYSEILNHRMNWPGMEL
jgi:hypothetical protein